MLLIFQVIYSGVERCKRAGSYVIIFLYTSSLKRLSCGLKKGFLYDFWVSGHAPLYKPRVILTIIRMIMHYFDERQNNITIF